MDASSAGVLLDDRVSATDVLGSTNDVVAERQVNGMTSASSDPANSARLDRVSSWEFMNGARHG